MSPPLLEFRPAAGWSVAFAAAAVVAVAAFAFTDVPGRILAAAVAVGCVAAAVGDRLAAPRLVVDAGGLTVGAVGADRHLAWADVEAVRVDERSRFGRLVRALEIDAGEALVVLGARALGMDPVTAARRIVAAAPAGRRAGLGGDVQRRWAPADPDPSDPPGDGQGAV